MSAHAGERAQETGDFRCERCHSQAHVTKGEEIARYPSSGKDTFDTRYPEPGNESG